MSNRSAWSLLALSAAGALVLAFVPPRYEVPQNDDWAYLLTVRLWFETGSLPHLGWNDPTLVGHAAWGALFASFLGVSYTSLRISTLVLAWVGVVATWGILRRCGLGRAASFLGAASLLFNPLYLVLSWSFNTDVPYVALAAASAWALLGALEAGSLARLAAAGALIACSYLIRQQGLVVAVVAAAWVGLVGWRGRPRRALAVTAVLGPTLVAAFLHAWWLRRVTGGTWLPALSQLDLSRFLQGAGPAADSLLRVARDGGAMLLSCGLFALPLVVAAALSLRRESARHGPWFAVALVVLAAGSLAMVASQPALRQGWPYQGNYVTRVGPLPSTDVAAIGPGWAWLAASFVAPVAATALVSAALQTARSAWTGSPAARQVALLLLLGLAQLLPSLLLTSVYDRYLLVALPAALVVAAAAIPLSARGVVGGFVALAALAVLSVEWTRAYVDHAKAQWEVCSDLVARGIPPAQIEGGFEWEGEHLYLAALRELGVRPPFRLDQGYPWDPLRDPRYSVRDAEAPGPAALASRSWRPFLERKERWVVAFGRR